MLIVHFRLFSIYIQGSKTLNDTVFVKNIFNWTYLSIAYRYFLLIQILYLNYFFGKANTIYPLFVGVEMSLGSSVSIDHFTGVFTHTAK